jgi:serine/threonine protein kinase
MFLRSKKSLFTAGELGDNLFIWIKEVFQLIGTPTSPEDIEWVPDPYVQYIRSLCSTQPSQSDWGRLSTVDETALDLVKKLLEFNPSKRITAKEALKHNYFDNMPLPNLPEAPCFSSSSFTPIVNVDQLTTTEQVRDAIENQIKQLQQNN